MKVFAAFFILLLFLNSVLSSDECEYLKRFCTPPCTGAHCMYNVAVYIYNCSRYKLLCSTKRI